MLGEMANVKQLFLRALSFVYLFAFSSLYPQISGKKHCSFSGLTMCVVFMLRTCGDSTPLSVQVYMAEAD